MGYLRADWFKVSREHPCRICGRADWCTFASDGAAKCMRAESDKPVDSGGWIHLPDAAQPIVIPKFVRKPKPRMTPAQLRDIAKGFFNYTSASAVRSSLSRQLGVTIESLEKLKVGYGFDAHNGVDFSSWPARDAVGNIVGIVRRYADGSKKSLEGGSTGLFYSLDWFMAAGPVLVVEGGSDTAAGLDLQLCIIGRPSNTGGGREIAQMIAARAPERPVIVVGERDEKPEKRGTTPEFPRCTTTCTGCSNCFPGKFGADKVARELGCDYVLPPKSLKDLRELKRSGVTWSELIRGLERFSPARSTSRSA